MISKLKDILVNLTSEQIALTSVAVTVIIYLLGKHNELKFKKHELKKDKYMQFVDLLKDNYLKGGDVTLNKEFKEKFFDFGSTLFIYGSKKIYKKYCFFREFSSEFIQKQKYYDKEIVPYLIADLLNQIRKEIGMYNFELSLNFKSISFFTNDIYFNPRISIKWWNCKIKVFLIKFELFICKLEEIVFLKILLYILAVPFKMLQLIIKYLIVIPFGKLIIKIGLDKKLNK